MKRSPARPAPAKNAAAGEKLLSPSEIRDLAEPYLRGFRPLLETDNALRGCWFVRFGNRSPLALEGGDPAANTEAGFFIGYILGEGALAELQPAPPECLAGAIISPVGGALHGQLVSVPGSLFRGTFTYIGWLTHRKPRFVFSEKSPVALVRHASMIEWPTGKRGHLSRNFFIESLAWLVRSGLVKRLLALPVAASKSA